MSFIGYFFLVSDTDRIITEMQIDVKHFSEILGQGLVYEAVW